MKYLILTDTHGEQKKVENLLNSVSHDGVFFLGDGVSDFDNIKENIIMVRGNCDFFSKIENTKIINIQNIKIMLTHGNAYGVKSGFGSLLSYAKKEQVDLVLFGHTHQIYLEEIDNITLCNVGSFKRNSMGKSTYGIIEFVSGKFFINIAEF